MMVNGLTLPSVLVDALRSGRLRRDLGVWQLKAEKDTYGNPLETDLRIIDSEEKIQQTTGALPASFQADGYYGESLADIAGPGAIADIIDFSQIVCFADSGDGAPFCLDFRESSTCPSVIWWDDVYWRRIAPDVASFFLLFDFDARDDGPGMTEEEWNSLKTEERKRNQERAREAFHQLSNGPPCPQCGKPLRTSKAQQCFVCGWTGHN